ncbi:hypothetical protein GUITHDRAFT_45184, partial [Guillardia theta CCMP2712]
PRDPRRVYANPVYPEICPILALGIYLLCYLPDELSLFPGRSQYKRFMQVLSKIMMPPNQSAAPITAHLRSLGLQPEDLGSHSIRKGAATYCSSGSTHCPSSSAVSERAGW